MITVQDAAVRMPWDPVPGTLWWGAIDPDWLGWGVFSAAGVLLLLLGARAGVPGAIRARPATASVALGAALSLLPHPAWAGGGWGSGTGPRSLRFYYQDHLGTDILVTTEAGDVVSRRVYDPFGKLEVEGVADQGSLVPPTEGSPGRFTGQRVESASGLYDFRARWYDPDTGRFLSVDPIIESLADPQTHNAYGYVRNNPSNAIDPTGEGEFGFLAFIIWTVIQGVEAYLISVNASGSGEVSPSPPVVPSAPTAPRPPAGAETTTAEGPGSDLGDKIAEALAAGRFGQAEELAEGLSQGEAGEAQGEIGELERRTVESPAVEVNKRGTFIITNVVSEADITIEVEEGGRSARIEGEIRQVDDGLEIGEAIKIKRQTIRRKSPARVSVPRVTGTEFRDIVIQVENRGPSEVKIKADVFVSSGRRVPAILASP